MGVILAQVLLVQHAWKALQDKMNIIARQYADPIATSVLLQTIVRTAVISIPSISQQKLVNSTVA